jgi:hypothetical protein
MPARLSDKDRMRVKTLGWWVVKTWDRDGRIWFHDSLLNVEIIWKFKAEARLNYKHPVRTSKRTHAFAITKINWLMLFKETIAVYNENHTNPTHRKRSVTECQNRSYIFTAQRNPLGTAVHINGGPHVLLHFPPRPLPSVVNNRSQFNQLQ